MNSSLFSINEQSGKCLNFVKMSTVGDFLQTEIDNTLNVHVHTSFISQALVHVKNAVPEFQIKLWHTTNIEFFNTSNSETKYINKDVHAFIFVEHINNRRTAQKSLLAGGNE